MENMIKAPEEVAEEDRYGYLSGVVDTMITLDLLGANVPDSLMAYVPALKLILEEMEESR